MSFDKDLFLNIGTEEAMETAFPAIPDGDYPAFITKLEANKFDGKDGKPDSYLLEVTWELTDEAVKAETGLEKPTARQRVFLDVAPSGALLTGKGKNIQLGRLRETLGQNRPGQPWNPNMLLGNFGTVRVRSEERNDRLYANVVAVAPAGQAI